MIKNSRKHSPWRRYGIGATALLTVLAFFGTAPIASADQMFLKIGSSSSSSSQYTYWVAAGQAIQAGTNGEIIPTIMETGASVDNLRRMERNESKLGLVTSQGAYQAYKGLGPFDGEPMSDVRVLWCYSALPTTYVVRKDAGVDSLEDLDGKRFNFGIPGSSTLTQTHDIFKTLNINPIEKSGSVSYAIGAIRDGDIVGMVKSAPAPRVADASFMQINASVPAKILNFSDADIASIQKKYPYISAVEIPAGVYPNQTESVRTPVVGVCGVSLKGQLSNEQAYDITKAVFENKSVQENAYPAAKTVDFAELTTSMVDVPLHAGAIRYFREIGVAVPSKLMPQK